MIKEGAHPDDHAIAQRPDRIFASIDNDAARPTDAVLLDGDQDVIGGRREVKRLKLELAKPRQRLRNDARTPS